MTSADDRPLSVEREAGATTDFTFEFGAHVPHPAARHSFLPADAPYAELAQRFTTLLLASERREAGDLILAASHEIPLQDIYLHVFQPALYEVGRMWETGRISVAREHYCTAVVQLIMSQLYPLIFSTHRIGLRMVVACVSGEQHEIGSRMVADLAELHGWDTTYLGAAVPSDAVIGMVREQRADVLAVSATLREHVPRVAELVRLARVDANELPNTRILVGGRPFNASPGLWREIGADASAADALSASMVAREVVAGKQAGK